MYCEHPEIDTPPDDAVLWRYINLEKLLDLLMTNSLYLARLDGFHDPWEGVWPSPVIKEIRENWPRGTQTGFFSAADSIRQTVFVSCWHISEHESAALWDQYGSASGFAIRSSIGRIKRALASERDFYIGRVKYLNYDVDHPGGGVVNVLTPALLKRKSFEHEKEARVLCWAMLPSGEVDSSVSSQRGMRLSLKPDELIERLYISPLAKRWISEPVRELAKRLDFGSLEIVHSNLYDKHVY